jgi:metal-sulfur cluster biosynthetic enzyme
VILTVDGLREAIDNYEELHSPTRRRTPTTAELVRGWLRQVINPLIGLDVVHTGILKEVNVIEGTVRVVVDLSEDHHLGSLIRECITEKLEPRWDVEQVIVEFSG